MKKLVKYTGFTEVAPATLLKMCTMCQAIYTIGDFVLTLVSTLLFTTVGIDTVNNQTFSFSSWKSQPTRCSVFPAERLSLPQSFYETMQAHSGVPPLHSHPQKSFCQGKYSELQLIYMCYVTAVRPGLFINSLHYWVDSLACAIWNIFFKVVFFFFYFFLLELLNCMWRLLMKSLAAWEE